MERGDKFIEQIKKRQYIIKLKTIIHLSHRVWEFVEIGHKSSQSIKKVKNILTDLCEYKIVLVIGDEG